MNHNALADLLFPDVTTTPEELEAQFPQRQLPEGAKVTRIAPSPTGFMHLGNLFGAIADERLAHQSGGVFYLRIEDTDQKREVDGGVDMILDVFKDYGLPFDEGATTTGDNGEYGPYRQRQRVQIYHVIAKQLVKQGLAYPCFCSEEQLSASHDTQALSKENFGYYGEYAICRPLTLDYIKANVMAGESYVLRLRSPGDLSRRVKFTDLVKGAMEFPENDQDIVLLKSDGIPTYHFAHVVDDHFMRTTHVIRGEEWLPSLPVHVQLFAALGWKPPKFIHTAQLMKMDGGSKRKLSKRKDPELALSYYKEQGYSISALKEYVVTLLNSNFEEWRIANPDKPLEDFPFSIKKMGVSGSLFDLDKLNDISKNVLSRLTATEARDQLIEWAVQYDPAFAALLSSNKDYATAILSIGRGGAKPRKDLAIWSDAKEYLSFFYDELFVPSYDYPANVQEKELRSILEGYAKLYNPEDDSDAWFGRVKQLAEGIGFAVNMKDYRKTPELFGGSVADVSMVLRLAITGRKNSPDLCEIMALLGRDCVLSRLETALKAV